MTTDSPFPFDYLEDTRPAVTTERYNIISGEFTAQRHFHGPWNKRFDFIFNYILKPIEFSGGTTLFAVPQPYPDLEIIHADSVAVRGEGIASVNPTTNAPLYDRARIDVTYKAHNFNFAAEPITASAAYRNAIFIEEDHDQYLDSLVIDGDKIKVAGVTAAAEDKFRFPLSKGDLVLTQQFAISPNWIALDFLKGRVNEKPFITPGGVVYGSETLKYDGYSAKSKINVTNTTGGNFPLPVWEMQHRFSFDAIGWNNKIDEDDFREKKTVRDAGGKRFFDRTNPFLIFLAIDQLPSVADLDFIQTQLDIIEDAVEHPLDGPAFFNAIAAIQQRLRDMGFRV